MDQQHVPAWYEVRIKDHLDDRWADWFDGMVLTRESDDTTTLCGPVIDQAALHGLLGKVRDLGATLISVQAVGNPDALREIPRACGPAQGPTANEAP